MSGPAKYGALIYSNDIRKLANFYAELFAMQIVRETAELISLLKDGFNIVIHTPPATMPQPEFNSVKLFLTVDHIETSQARAVALGGQSLAGVWSNPLFSVANIVDPDGNHVQLREFIG